MRTQCCSRDHTGVCPPRWVLLLAGAAVAGGASWVWAAQPDGLQLARAAPTQATADEHAHHHHMVQPGSGHTRSLATYEIPDVTLLDENGSPISLASALNGQGPLMLNFIFTSCTAICPVLTATFSQVQDALGEQGDRVRMVSISIDPERDTPARLKSYAARFGAGPQWQFLTGDLPEVVAVQKAFDAYRGEKASHVPLTFLHAGSDDPWVRIEGFVSAAQLVDEYHGLAGR